MPSKSGKGAPDWILSLSSGWSLVAGVLSLETPTVQKHTVVRATPLIWLYESATCKGRLDKPVYLLWRGHGRLCTNINFNV